MRGGEVRKQAQARSSALTLPLMTRQNDHEQQRRSLTCPELRRLNLQEQWSAMAFVIAFRPGYGK